MLNFFAVNEDSRRAQLLITGVLDKTAWTVWNWIIVMIFFSDSWLGVYWSEYFSREKNSYENYITERHLSIFFRHKLVITKTYMKYRIKYLRWLAK